MASLIAVTFIVWAATSYFLFRNKRGLPALSDEDMRMYAVRKRMYEEKKRMNAVKNMTHLVVFAEDATSEQMNDFSRTAMFRKEHGEPGGLVSPVLPVFL